MRSWATPLNMKDFVVTITLRVMRGLATPLRMEDSGGVFHANRRGLLLLAP